MLTVENFDRIDNHLLAQNEQSQLGGCCTYRGKEGKKCAIGCLIPDHMYNVHMESKSIKALMIGTPSLIPLFTPYLDAVPSEIMGAMEGCDSIGMYHTGPCHWAELFQRVHDVQSPDQWPSILGKLRAIVVRQEGTA